MITRKNTVLKNKGLHTHRFKDNPDEKRFAVAWDQVNEMGENLAWLLDSRGVQTGRPNATTERERVVAATAIQWLGSPVGLAFLRDLGFEKKEPGTSSKPTSSKTDFKSALYAIGRRGPTWQEKLVLDVIEWGNETYPLLEFSCQSGYSHLEVRATRKGRVTHLVNAYTGTYKGKGVFLFAIEASMGQVFGPFRGNALIKLDEVPEGKMEESSKRAVLTLLQDKHFRRLLDEIEDDEREDLRKKFTAPEEP